MVHFDSVMRHKKSQAILQCMCLKGLYVHVALMFKSSELLQAIRNTSTIPTIEICNVHCTRTYIPVIVPLGDVIIISVTSSVCTEKKSSSSFVDIFRLAHTRLSPGCSSRVTGGSLRSVGTNTESVYMYFMVKHIKLESQRIHITAAEIAPCTCICLLFTM